LADNRDFNVKKSGANGLDNYSHALWGEGYIPDPQFPQIAIKLFENHSERLARLQEDIERLQTRLDGIQMQLGQARGDSTKPKHDGPGLQEILGAVARKWRVTQSAIKSYSREGRVVEARKEAYTKSRQAGFSYPEIGRFYGGRCHTTVHDAVRKSAIESVE